MGDFTGVAGQFVAAPRAAALQVPVDPRATAYEGPKATGDEAASLEIKVDGHPVRLIPTHESVRHVVGTAYLIGGFGLVLSLEAAVRRRVAVETLALDQLRSAVRALVEEKRKRPQYASTHDRASSDQMAAIPRAQARLQIASDVLRLLLEAWARIAAAEEQVLREYEPKLIMQFVKLAKDAGSIALREWARYEPYDTTVTDVLALSTSEAKERSMVDLRLRKEAVELVKAVHDLHESWKDYLDSLDSSRKVAAMGARKLSLLNPGSNPAEQVRYSRLHVADKFAAFDARRSEIGTQFPAALQVYGKLGRLSGSDLRPRNGATNSQEYRGKNDIEIERWVIAALIEAVESSQELGYQALMHPLFKAGERLRVEASDGHARGSNLRGYQKDLLARGLTVPASRVIADLMEDVDEAAKSPWFQLPVRLALFKRGTEGDDALSPYVAPGRLHHAALSEVNNALQEVRHKQRENLDQALLIMDAIAMPAGFFTGGTTVAIAGVIHAVVRGREMYLTVKEYQAHDALAQMALVPLQQALWEHPSAVTLAGKLLEGGFEIATDVVNGGVAGALLDAIQVSLTIGYGAQAVREWLAGDDLLDGAQ